MNQPNFSWKIWAITFILLVAGFMYSCFIRSNIHAHAFYGMSKTSKRKILRSQSKFSYIFMTYAPKYNNPKRTRLCLLCYYLHLFCVLFIFCFNLFNVFIAEAHYPPLIFLFIYGFILCGPIITFISRKTLGEAKTKTSWDFNKWFSWKVVLMLLVYYVFCIGWASFTGAIFASLFLDDIPAFPWVDLLRIAYIAFLICMFSVLIPFKNKSYKLPKNPQ